jgi:hypothetical protein
MQGYSGSLHLQNSSRQPELLRSRCAVRAAAAPGCGTLSVLSEVVTWSSRGSGEASSSGIRWVRDMMIVSLRQASSFQPSTSCLAIFFGACRYTSSTPVQGSTRKCRWWRRGRLLACICALQGYARLSSSRSATLQVSLRRTKGPKDLGQALSQRAEIPRRVIVANFRLRDRVGWGNVRVGLDAVRVHPVFVG